MASFKGDPPGSPIQTNMNMTSDQNYNARARDPWRIPLSFASTVWGYTHDDVHWYAQKTVTL